MRTFPQRTVIVALIILSLLPSLSFGATRKKVKASKKAGSAAIARPASKPPKPVVVKSRRGASVKGRSAKTVVAKSKRRGRGGMRRGTEQTYVAGGPWQEPTFADSTIGDNVDGEDLAVRRAAVDALGPYNGTVVVVDPNTGRVLTMVNQKLALKNGFQPCSTIKIVAGLAGLAEGVIDRSTQMRLYGRVSMNLTNALALSNNPYFANIGIKLGFEKVNYYARLLGLGEKAGLNIDGEQAGTLPDSPPANGGMGMMTSFGEGITLTPLQLASMIGSIANGGTLMYLQHPRSQKEAEQLVPRIKRHLAIQQMIPELKPGMNGATEFGTARRAYYDPNEPIFGKTGTCTDRRTPTHLGWFGSFNEVAGGRKLVVVVLLTGGRPINGPVASGIAGQIYKNLSMQKYYATTKQTISPVALVSGSPF